MQEQWVEFVRSGITINTSRQTAAVTRLQNRAAPTSLDEELLLTVPDNLTELERDKYLMVCLNKHNSDIVEGYIAIDPSYQFFTSNSAPFGPSFS